MKKIIIFMVLFTLVFSGCSSNRRVAGASPKKPNQEIIPSEEVKNEVKKQEIKEELKEEPKQEIKEEVKSVQVDSYNEKKTSTADPYEKGEQQNPVGSKPAEAKPNQKQRIAYLTIDDFPSPNTIVILDTLKKYDIKATFFPSVEEGEEEFAREMFKRMVSEGHTIGNHTYSHDYSIVYSTVDKYLEETDKLNNFIFEATGIRPDIIRYPGGSNNRVSNQYGGQAVMSGIISKMKELGYEYFDWNVSSADSAMPTVPKERIVENILKGAKSKDKAIILMHQTKLKTTTAEALPEVIEGLKGMGFKFEVLSKSSYKYQFKR